MFIRFTAFGIMLSLCNLFLPLTSDASLTPRHPATLTSSQTLNPKQQADALYQEGNQLFKKNRWRLALEKYKQALWIYLDLGDKGAIAKTLVQIGVTDNWLKPVRLSEIGMDNVPAYVKQAVATRKQILEKLNLKNEGNGREFFQEALRLRRRMRADL
jgi:tetratricopeptide (TPR) repeat protein